MQAQMISRTRDASHRISRVVFRSEGKIVRPQDYTKSSIKMLHLQEPGPGSSQVDGRRADKQPPRRIVARP